MITHIAKAQILKNPKVNVSSSPSDSINSLKQSNKEALYQWIE